MNGKNLFLGLSYIDRKFIEEAETDTIPAKRLSIRRPLLVAAMIGLMLLLVGCGIMLYSLVQMRVKESKIMYGQTGETKVGEAVCFEETDDVYIELGAYYPQQIPEGYTMTFVTEGAPLQRQYIDYENEAGQYIEYCIMIGDPSSSVEIYDITGKSEVDIKGTTGILYEYGNKNRILVWIAEEQGYGFFLRTDDASVDLVEMAESTGAGEPLTPSRAESTVKALEELGDVNPSYLPEGYEENGVMGAPLAEGGGWYSYVRKYYVNKAENTRIYFEYESYAIDTESGYEDNAKTVCSFFIPGCNILDGEIVGEEAEISGMYALVTGNHIAWADPQRHVVYHLTSEDVLNEELLKVAQSIR